jgi:hypothetical protein
MYATSIELIILNILRKCFGYCTTAQAPVIVPNNGHLPRSDSFLRLRKCDFYITGGANWNGD